MNGRELTNDLAQHLRFAGWLAFTELVLPHTGGRADVVALMPHRYAQKDIRVYEVKVSRQDFHADERANKWRKYLEVCHCVYFAAPRGLLKVDEIPKDAGLIVYGDNGWHVLKAPRGHKPPALGIDDILAMLFRGQEEQREMRRLSDRIDARENIPLKQKAKRIGWEIGKRLDRGKNNKDQGLELWAQRILEICEKITGKDMDEYFDRADIENTLTHAIEMQKYADMVNEIGGSLQALRYPNPKRLLKQSLKVKQILGKQNLTISS